MNSGGDSDLDLTAQAIREIGEIDVVAKAHPSA
jgi:hypothetical protein